MVSFRRPLAVLAMSAVGSVLFAQGIQRTIDPKISPDGSRIAFVWQGDLFVVSSQGGPATRLTVHPATEGFPLWAPDGSRIFFQSNRAGNFDIYSVAPDGSDLKRITFAAADQFPTGITTDGQRIFGYTSAFGGTDLFTVSTKGGELIRLTTNPMEPEAWPVVSPEGRTVFYTGSGSTGGWRNPYARGSMTNEIFAAEFGAPLRNHRRLTNNDANDMFPAWGGNRIYFMSNRSGDPNIWSMRPDGSDARQHTRFTNGTIRAVSVNTEGTRVAFQKDSTLWVLDVASGNAAPLSISAPADSRRDVMVTRNIQTGFSAFVTSPDGKRSVFEAGGELFLTTANGGVTRRLTESVRPDAQPQWIDDKTVLFTQVTEGSKRRLMTVTDAGAVSLWFEDAKDVMGAVVSPDRKWVAFSRGDQEILIRPIEGGAVRVLAKGAFSGALAGQRVFTWSPDSRALVIPQEHERGVRIEWTPIDGSQPTVLARVGKGVSSPPVITPDGLHLLYGGLEGLNYSEARNSTTPLYAVRLVPETVTFAEDALETASAPAASGERKPMEVVVRERGLEQRTRVLTSASVGQLTPSPDGRAVWTNVDGQFSAISLADGSVRPVAGVTGSAAVVEATGQRLVLSVAGRLQVLDLRNQTVAPLAVSARFAVNQQEEEKALFEEVWWAMDRLYYDPRLNGKDWQGIKREFEPLVSKVTSRTDFYALMGEMMERLDSSHLGATSPPEPAGAPVERMPVGWIGVLFDPGQLMNGRYVVSHVYVNTPADNPASELKIGDQVLAVDGRKLDGSVTFVQTMENKVGARVRLTVVRDGNEIEVAIRPSSAQSLTGLNYQEWVARNRRIVDELSNGDFGYVHIEGMDAPSLDLWLKEIQTRLDGKKGVVVDVRYNGGGFTSHIILNIMRKEPWLIRTNRDMPGVRMSENNFRGNALEMPAVCLTNQYSFSNAEIFSEGFQRLGLGPVLGEATAGGVIGTGGYSLWDGGFIRMPGSGAFAVDGENLERNGRKPNIEVKYDPNQWLQGRDPVLERAVQELRKRIRS